MIIDQFVFACFKSSDREAFELLYTPPPPGCFQTFEKLSKIVKVGSFKVSPNFQKFADERLKKNYRCLDLSLDNED